MSPFKIKIILIFLVPLSLNAYVKESIYIEENSKRKDATLFIPRNPGRDIKRPLIVLLHGYANSAKSIKSFLPFNKFVDQKKFLLAIPSGVKDRMGFKFWNATKYCCDFFNKEVDDVGYLNNLIEKIKRSHLIDEKQIYIIGHSNGGFMAHRMACDSSENISGIVSIAGTNFLDIRDCHPKRLVNVLQIHGKKDIVVNYNGKRKKYPSALSSAKSWAFLNGCDFIEFSEQSINLRKQGPLKHILKQKWLSCVDQTSVELWSLKKGRHGTHIKQTGIKLILDNIL